MINLYSFRSSDTFFVRHYYNVYICVYQFVMFLTKFSIFVFVNRRIELYALAQFVICVITGYFVLFRRLCLPKANLRRGVQLLGLVRRVRARRIGGRIDLRHCSISGV